MVYNKKSVRDIDVSGKKVLLRLDLNVPVENGTILDDNRIIEALPTVRYLLRNNAAVIMCSHMGRPKGKIVPELSLRIVADYMQNLLDQPVIFAHDVVGPETVAAAEKLQPGQVMMMENTRFDPAEEKNDPEFSRRMAALADIYVDDAFGTAHRAHASTAGVADYLPSACGFLIEKELNVLGKVFTDPHPPVVAVLGGAKVKDKLSLISSMIDRVQEMLICGGMAYTFIKALGGRIGNSLCDDSKIEECLAVLRKAESRGVRIHLPTDVIATDRISQDAKTFTCDAFAIPEGFEGADIGSDTRVRYARIIENAGTVIWNGPSGVFEVEQFSHGTRALAEACLRCKGMTIIGGGDSGEAVRKWGMAGGFTHVSTGGGAALEFLEGLDLPGIACLDDKE